MVSPDEIAGTKKKEKEKKKKKEKKKEITGTLHQEGLCVCNALWPVGL